MIFFFGDVNENPHPQTKKNTPSSDGVFFLVSLTTTRVETFFGELEYIELRLRVLHIIDASNNVKF